ncbi:hypothetical protein FHR56_000209 [Xanthomonas sacchari]|uniref:hypothetical protein n=1 Tax=unclassified Xanthomonas TaxID=2643310 RepID=UPI001371D1F3|nr:MULTISPECIES: hypothetical protein [unclassified Xanthomonas]MBB6365096.1 hypothetical protein [Xanthomonas sp. F10]MXV34687.1 hypothetical protein [Xanthomonas sp. LMG 8989]
MPSLSPPDLRLAHRWTQTGRISLWRYLENERNYPGWHLNADAPGCRSLVMLLDALAADGDGARVIAITAPTRAELAVPNNRRGRAAWVAPEKLRLTVSTTDDRWSFPPDLAPAALDIGAAWLTVLRDGIDGIPKGRGDHCIGRGDLRLWFWW